MRKPCNQGSSDTMSNVEAGGLREKQSARNRADMIEDAVIYTRKSTS